MTSRIERTIARQQEKINSGQYYESHQQLRVIVARYLKQGNYDAAADILFGGATALLKAGPQQGAAASGGDLAIMLVKDVYVKAEWEITDDELGTKRKERLIQLLKEFPVEEPTRKRYINEIVQWSAEFGDFETGDPDIHHAVGSILATENEPYEAESHLLLGSKDSAEILSHLEYEWYTYDEKHTAGLYAARAVLPYLLTGNLRNANKAFQTFTSRLSSNSALPVQQVSSQSTDMCVYPSLPLLNFIGLLLVSAQRGSPDLFRQLTSHYAHAIEETEGWDRPLVHIGEIYFEVRVPRQSNPLMDMMGMMFGGGPRQEGDNRRQSRRSRRAGKLEGPPPTMEVD